MYSVSLLSILSISRKFDMYKYFSIVDNGNNNNNISIVFVYIIYYIIQYKTKLEMLLNGQLLLS